MSERRNLVRANGTRVSQNGGKADSSRFGNTPGKQRRTGAGKHLKYQKYSAPAENTDKVVAKGRSLYGKPDANGNDSDSEDEDGGSGHHEELLAGDASVDRGYISDADQYGVQRRHETEHPEDEALDGMDHRSLPGTRGKMSEEERIDLPRKVKLQHFLQSSKQN